MYRLVDTVLSDCGSIPAHRHRIAFCLASPSLCSQVLASRKEKSRYAWSVTYKEQVVPLLVGQGKARYTKELAVMICHASEFLSTASVFMLHGLLNDTRTILENGHFYVARGLICPEGTCHPHRMAASS
jgi:hypothetical protein